MRPQKNLFFASLGYGLSNGMKILNLIQQNGSILQVLVKFWLFVNEKSQKRHIMKNFPKQFYEKIYNIPNSECVKCLILSFKMRNMPSDNLIRILNMIAKRRCDMMMVFRFQQLKTAQKVISLNDF